MTNKQTSEQFKACIIGGAVGDALGAPIESMTMDQVRSNFGDQGLTEYTKRYSELGAITDNTQTVLFTTEGLILSRVRREYKGDQGVIASVYHALLRWLYTQGTTQQGTLIQNHGTCSIVDGVLTGFRELFVQRSPDEISLSALASNKMSTPTDPLNQSKYCSGITRSAPVGLAFDDPEKAFYFGCQIAALTHGHPTAYLSAGTLGALISLIMSESTISSAIESSCHILKTHQHHDETLRSISNAMDIMGRSTPEPEVINEIAANWTAAEALGVSLYCCLEAKTEFKKGILLSVNHSGPSSATGTITGSILGTINGMDAIPQNWVSDLELKELIEETACDLYQHFGLQRPN